MIYTRKYLLIVSLAACVWMAEWFAGSVFYKNICESGLEEGKIETSKAFISERNVTECAFPSAYDETSPMYPLEGEDGGMYAARYRLSWRNKAKHMEGWKDDYKVNYILQWIDEQEKDYITNATKPVPALQDHRLTFVHIGKAGGSTIRCSLRISRILSNHCLDKEGPPQESAISRHVNCLTHEKSNLLCYFLQGTPSDKKPHLSPTGNDYLVNLKNPLDRIASWFTYEHIENHDFVHPTHQIYCGQTVLNSCYRHFDDLVNEGLSYPKPNLEEEYLRVGTDLNATECSQWAWAAVTGSIPADHHNWYNYDWYAHRMLINERTNKADIFALRMEHLEQDWATVDRMLGGDGAIPPGLLDSKNMAAEKPLRVKGSKVRSSEGIANLCRAMCPEIQAYKQLLSRAVNLSPVDVETSLSELRKQCPEEVSIETRDCGTY